MQQYDKLTQTLMFPTIIKQLRGSDTDIEFVTTLTLQTIRLAVKNFVAVRKSAYIFVQTDLMHQKELNFHRQIEEQIRKNGRLPVGTEAETDELLIGYRYFRIEYTDAMARAKAAEKFYKEILKI